MFGLNLFIAGIEKCGTTSLADWFVNNGLAKYRVPGIKEPYSYAAGNVSVNHGLAPPGVLLDASVGYSFNPQAIARMPEHNTKIVLCLRNQFERCFSAYCFYQTIARRDQSSAALLETAPVFSGLGGQEKNDSEAFFELLFHINRLHFSTKTEPALRGYFLEQADNICRQSFRERIDYEISFFLSRRSFPFFSVLGPSSFTYPLRNLLARYQARDICLLTLDQLATEEARGKFVKDLLGPDAQSHALPPVPSLNTTQGTPLNHAKPNFHDREWDFLRNYLRHDLTQFRSTIDSAGVSLRYVNLAMLEKYLAGPGRAD